MLLEIAGVVLAGQLEELEQIDELVVPPVAEVRPRLIGVGGLPVVPVLGDAIGVVAVGRRGVDEPADHAFQILGKGKAQSFPVLEDVAPVSLVVQHLRTVSVLDVDRELVPGPAGVAVSTAERDRQVLEHESKKLRVVERSDPLPGVGRARRLSPSAFRKPSCRAQVFLLKARTKSFRSAERNGIGRLEDTAPHHVEEHVGKVVGGAESVAGLLQSVGPSDDRRQTPGALFDVFAEPGSSRPTRRRKSSSGRRSHRARNPHPRRSTSPAARREPGLASPGRRMLRAVRRLSSPCARRRRGGTCRAAARKAAWSPPEDMSTSRRLPAKPRRARRCRPESS